MLRGVCVPFPPNSQLLLRRVSGVPLLSVTPLLAVSHRLLLRLVSVVPLLSVTPLPAVPPPWHLRVGLSVAVHILDIDPVACHGLY